MCIEAEFDAHNFGAEFEWNENVEGAVRILKNGEIVMESRLKPNCNGLYELAMINVKRRGNE